MIGCFRSVLNVFNAVIKTLYKLLIHQQVEGGRSRVHCSFAGVIVGYVVVFFKCFFRLAPV